MTDSRLPPLIDRDVFLDDPELAGAQLSPDGRFLAFLKTHGGAMNLWVKGLHEPFEAARPVSASARSVPGFFWSRDARLLLFVQDAGGDENYHLFAVDPAAPAAPDTGVPPARNLTPAPGAQAAVIALPKGDPLHAVVGLNDRDPQVHDVYRVNLHTAERTRVHANTQGVAGWTCDLQGALRLGYRMTEDGGWELLRVEGERLTPIYRCSAEETCEPVRFHPDGRRVYLKTNRGERDLVQLTLLHVETGEETHVDADPEGRVDLFDVEFSAATEELAATFYLDDRQRSYPRSAGFAKAYEAVRRSLPDGDLFFTSSTLDERLRVVVLTSDVDPGATYLYDRDAGTVQLLYRPYPRLPVEHLAPMQPVRYTARDGVGIPGYLTLPRGVEPKGLPTVVLVHGGPWHRDLWGYDATTQLLANRGYAVLMPNFRGSTGYGKRFLNLGNGQWGTGTMQHDLSDAVAWLVAQGIADPRRVAIMGGSYGGYATLAGLAFTPELYAAGVDIVGPSSILTLLESIPPYWAPMKKIFDVRVGDAAKPEEAERLRSQSPLYAAERIRAPLLIVQGANDPRVKQTESDQIVSALHALGRTVRYLVAADEGHGFVGRTNRVAMMAEIERFLREHLGGRAEPTLAPDIAGCLARLSVDPARLAASR